MTVEYFKVTKFGRYVLGINKEEYQKEEMYVTEDFEVVIGKTNRKLKYELYFDRFLKKIKEEPLTYELEF